MYILKDTKVCHLTTVHSVDDIRIFAKECTSLAEYGFDVTLIACENIEFNDVKNGVKRISLSVPVRNRLQRIIKRPIAIYRKALQVDADLYHIHDPELLPIGLKLKRKGKRVIFDSHEFYGEAIRVYQYIPVIFRILIAKIYTKYETYVCCRIDAVIQVCKINGKNYFENRAKRSIFITNASITDEVVPSKEIPFDNRKSIAHVGSLTYKRGITHLVKAAARTNTDLILIGKFDSEDYQKEIVNLKEYSVVNYLGYLDKREIDEVLNKCFAGVSTLLQIGQFPKIDTFPTKVYEYMTLGLPVIISNTSFAKEMIEKYKFGISVDPSSVEEISDAINYLHNNPGIAEKMGENGRLAVLKEFNWQIEEVKLIQLYNFLLNR